MPCFTHTYENPRCIHCTWNRIGGNAPDQPQPNPEVAVPEPQIPIQSCTHCQVPIGPGSGNEPDEGCTCSDGRCAWCCACYQCASCTTAQGRPVRHTSNTGAAHARGGRAQDRCMGCASCLATCSCPTCSNCHRRRPSDDRCTTCGRGAGCCGACRCSRGWDYYRPEATKFWHGRKSKRVPIVRLASLEIETNRCAAPAAGAPFKLMDTAKKWTASMVEDGSVNAFELNTAPASGHLLQQQVHELCEALKAGRAQVGSNCGVHCHVDTRDFHYWDIRRLVQLWRLCEKGIYALADPSRMNNHYCEPCGEKYHATFGAAKTTRDLKAAVTGAAYGRRPDRTAMNRKAIASASKYGNGVRRYSALNLHSWLYRGTVENRILHATTDETTLLNWALINIALVQCALAWSQARITALHPSGREPTRDQSVKMLAQVAATVGLNAYVLERAAAIKRAGENAFLA